MVHHLLLHLLLWLPLHRSVSAWWLSERNIENNDEEGTSLFLKEFKLENSCWHKAYSSLSTSCREVLRHDDKKMRLAYEFTDCFLQHSGKPMLKRCPEFKECTKALDKYNHQVLLEFFSSIGTICYHLQSELFKLETEFSISNLRDMGESVESRLGAIDDQAMTILESTDKVFALQQLLSKDHVQMERSLVIMLQHGLILDKTQQKLDYDQTSSQLEELSYQLVQDELSSLRHKAESVARNAFKSLTLQEELLIGQDAARSRLEHLKELHQQALEEAKRYFTTFAEVAKQSQEDLHQMSDVLLRDQELLDSVIFSTISRLHKGIFAESKTVKEILDSMLTVIFTTLDPISRLQKAIFAESKTLKMIFFYASAAVLIYFLTGVKYTRIARIPLYLGMSAPLGIEMWIIRGDSSYVRQGFAVVAASFILFCILTYREYDTLNNKILLELEHKLNKHTRVLGYLTAAAPAFAEEAYVEDTCFQNYKDPLAEEDRFIDPDYVPQLNFEMSGTLRSYDLRQEARRPDRPLALTASMLEWETEEMFIELFTID